jgi:hypothetical protein
MRAMLLFMGLAALMDPGPKNLLEAQVPSVRQERPDTLPPDTIPVDSTRLRIQMQLQNLARPPGIDSTFFLPDSLLPDSLLALKQARSGRGGLRGGRATAPSVRGGLTGGDSVVTALKELEGYSVTEYQSVGADFEAKERRLILLGTPDDMARIIADGQEITADSLFYSEESGKVWSSGSTATFQPQEGEPVNSRIIVFDLAEERGTALGATTKYSGGGEWIVHGDLTSVTDTASYGNRLMFTSCELDVPHYHFASNNVKIVRGNLLVARPVKLYFADVPVAWLPFMVQNLEQGRSSGILTPTFSVNDIVRTSQNYSRRISNLGFYWAASDYWDATVFLDWWSGEHTALTGSLRYDWAKQFLGGSASFRRFWREGGSKELAFDGNTQWEMSERTRLRVRGRYASSTSMVRETSFDPMEVVQSIDSEGGLTHRFDFGNLTLSANRKQYLNDDRVEMTLPNLSFSLSPQTFFKASPSQARFYNNITWSGSASFRRNVSDRPEQPDTAEFNPSQADLVRTDARMTTSLNLGNVSLGGGLDFSENLVKGVPVGMPLTGTLGPEDPSSIQDQSTAEAGWNASLGYQQRLIGSTTLTPSFSVSGRLKRSDTDPLATEFVSGPTRMSLGVNLRTDLYGFFPGFGPFEAIRHKISPGFDFSYSPEVSPTDLQREVFGAADVRAQRTLMISLNQTFEAKQSAEALAEARAAQAAQARGARPGQALDSLGVAQADTMAMARDSLVLDSLAVDSLRADSARGPGQSQPDQKFILLALKTSAINYDFEEAAEREDWLWGVTSTLLTNTISSDYLRGLNVTMAHDLFDDSGGGSGEGGEGGSGRKFSPHLSSLNFGFSLDGRSFPFKQIGQLLGGGRGADTVAAVAPVAEEDSVANPFAPSLMDESSIVPTGSDPSPRARGRRGGGMGGAGGWRANLRFSMQRPRDETRQGNQMIQGDLSFSLTENWDASWRTSYDLIEGSFNDHYVQLTRNLHRWEAHFDFRKAATGNWSFRFEVALTDQEDLHFDYSQRSHQGPSGDRRF